MGFSRAARIKTLLVIDSAFFFLEIIVGYAVGSLALVADSFHMLNDVISLIVALYAIKLASSRGASDRYSYGWQRAEVLGALINGVFLLALCFSIFLEAVERLFNTTEVGNPKLVVIVGSAGLASNIIGLFLFHEHGHSHGHSHGGHGDDSTVDSQGQSHHRSLSHSSHKRSHSHHTHKPSITQPNGDASRDSITLPIPVTSSSPGGSTVPSTSSSHVPLQKRKSKKTRQSVSAVFDEAAPLLSAVSPLGGDDDDGTSSDVEGEQRRSTAPRLPENAVSTESGSNSEIEYSDSEDDSDSTASPPVSPETLYAHPSSLRAEVIRQAQHIGYGATDRERNADEESGSRSRGGSPGPNSIDGGGRKSRSRDWAKATSGEWRNLMGRSVATGGNAAPKTRDRTGSGARIFGNASPPSLPGRERTTSAPSGQVRSVEQIGREEAEVGMGPDGWDQHQHQPESNLKRVLKFNDPTSVPDDADSKQVQRRKRSRSKNKSRKSNADVTGGPELGGEHYHDGDDHGHGSDDGHGHSHGHGHSAGGHGHSHGSMNMKGVFLHVMGDALGNIGVIGTGLLIWLSSWQYRFYFDPIISLVITIIIFSSALPLVKSASFILLQGVPSTIPLDQVRDAIFRVPGVIDVHELHVWSLSENKYIASVHVLVETREEFMEVSRRIRHVMHQWGIHSSTIQPEIVSEGALVPAPVTGDTPGAEFSTNNSMRVSVGDAVTLNQPDGSVCRLACVDASCLDNSCCPPPVRPPSTSPPNGSNSIR